MSRRPHTFGRNLSIESPAASCNCVKYIKQKSGKKTHRVLVADDLKRDEMMKYVTVIFHASDGTTVKTRMRQEGGRATGFYSAF